MAFWHGRVREVLNRHDLSEHGADPVPGSSSTHPTFVCGDVVVKLFGRFRGWRRSFQAERAAHARLEAHASIRAPRVVAEGWLYEGAIDPWPYLVTERVQGQSWAQSTLTDDQRRAVAAELGEQVLLLHALPVDGALSYEDWDPPDGMNAAGRTSLPPHLVEQVGAYLADLGPDDPVFVHADLIDAHVFIDGGQLAGVIDWGDAIVADRHLELIQPFRGLFDCDRELFGVFLEAANWPIDENFARRALGQALRRQAVGLAQHRGMDVFEPIAAKYPLRDIPTLDDLAAELFSR